ncbi:hypothetical protein BKA58DRAFT_50292 [Alternaria rosae]|uniref:uncharacterized protein n=1 Tax=Alternaria rosae TaxID=1187941 RepID=UPI001E8E3124|nr:uncharacterized protein BKA58DRAFT_50292 [Alternaria rosae]KAH6858898.1 hypothetical protein BKA58DRAFT_50292 [Alternaria rosae]
MYSIHFISFHPQTASCFIGLMSDSSTTTSAKYDFSHYIQHRLSVPTISSFPSDLDLLASNLLSMLLESVRGVAAQAVLGVVASLLSALLGSCALAVDVVGGLTGLRSGLALGLGRLTAGVGGGHGCGLGVVWGVRFGCFDMLDVC